MKKTLPFCHSKQLHLQGTWSTGNQIQLMPVYGIKMIQISHTGSTSYSGISSLDLTNSSSQWELQTTEY